MKNCFRIIELPEYQVLLTKDFNQENDDAPMVSVAFFVEGLKIENLLTFEDEVERDLIFEKYNEENANNFISVALNVIKK